MSRRAQRKAWEAEWASGCDDARYLAVELAAGRPYRPIDVMALGFVLEPGETAYRFLSATLNQHDARVGGWSMPAAVRVLVTDQRVVIRMKSGVVFSLWWNGLVATDLRWTSGHVVLDYGDGEPRALSGTFVADIAVAVAVGAYGIESLLTHEALSPLRLRAGMRPHHV